MPVFPAQQSNWLNAWKIKEKVAISSDLSNLAEHREQSRETKLSD